MTFANLTAEMQNLVLIQYSFMFKSVILFGGLIFAVFYLFYWKKEKELPTPFFSVGIMRSIITILSWLTLILFPLLLLLLNPEYELLNAVSAFFPVYLTLIVLACIGLIVDMFYFTPTLLLKIGGFDTGDKKVDSAFKVVKQYFKKNG
jgi:magnesium-transporting ATPase (P-type)